MKVSIARLTHFDFSLPDAQALTVFIEANRRTVNGIWLTAKKLRRHVPNRLPYTVSRTLNTAYTVPQEKIQTAPETRSAWQLFVINCLRFVAVPLILPLFFTASAAAATVSCSSNSTSLFGLPTWYSYLQVQENPVTHSCDIVNFKVPAGFLLIGLALLDIALRLAGLVAIGFVIYGGFQYVTSQGEPDKTAKAQHTILDALIGLAITFVSVGVVAFLGSKLG